MEIYYCVVLRHIKKYHSIIEVASPGKMFEFSYIKYIFFFLLRIILYLDLLQIFYNVFSTFVSYGYFLLVLIPIVVDDLVKMQHIVVNS